MVEMNLTRRSAYEGLHAIGVEGKLSITPSAYATRYSFRGDAQAAALRVKSVWRHAAKRFVESGNEVN